MLINEIIRIIIFIWEAVVHIWPLLLITVPLTVLIKEFKLSDDIQRFFTKNIWVSILLATLIGAISPLCSCSVIPVISGLLMAGVPLAPIMSFWLASPSMDPEIFFLSVGSLGMPLAVARIVATFVMSLAGGIITHFLIGRGARVGIIGKMKRISFSRELSAVGVTGEIMKVEVCETCEGPVEPVCDSCTSPEGQVQQVENHIQVNHVRRILGNLLSTFWFILKFMLIAYLLEALIQFYVPEEVISTIFGRSEEASVIIATLLGIPMYTTNISALGLVGGMLDKGLSGGAGLAFLIGGATTTIPAMAAVYKLVEKWVFILYLSLAIGFSLVSGMIYNWIF